METVTERQAPEKVVIPSIVKINGDSKECFDLLLKKAKVEVVILSRNWKDVIFQEGYHKIFDEFLAKSVSLKIIFGSANPGPSPEFFSKYLSISEFAIVKAYVTDEKLCGALFNWNPESENKYGDKNKRMLNEYPVIGDDSMYHLRTYDKSIISKTGNWYSKSSYNDPVAVASIRNRLNALQIRQI